MCNFFSFISDGSGNFFYADAKLRRSKKFKVGNFEPDSHTSLAAWFLKDPVADDRVNKYEYLNEKFVIDQINVADDSGAAKAWVKKFIETDEFQKICLEVVKRHGCALEFVKDQTPEICLEAVKKDGYLFK